MSSSLLEGIGFLDFIWGRQFSVASWEAIPNEKECVEQDKQLPGSPQLDLVALCSLGLVSLGAGDAARSYEG